MNIGFYQVIYRVGNIYSCKLFKSSSDVEKFNESNAEILAVDWLVIDLTIEVSTHGN